MENSPARFIQDINEFAESHDQVSLVDPINSEVANDIAIARFGKTDIDSPDAKALFDRVVSDANYGSWVHFPWRSEAHRFPDKDDYYAVRTSRNRQMITEEQQQILRSKSIVHIGLSVGSNIALESTRLGIGNKYTLVDDDTIGMTNLNRIRAGIGQVGLRKTEWLGRELALIDPYIEQTQITERYTESTEELIDDSRADILVEEVDDLRAKALLRQYAKSRCIPLIMVSDIGESSLIDIERHDIESVKPFNGRLSPDEFEALLSGDIDPSQEQKLKIKIIGPRNIPPRLLESAMDPDLDGLPQLSTTVAIGAGMGAAAIAGIFLGRNNSSLRSKVSQRKVLGLKPQQSLPSAVGTWRRMLTAQKKS